jgi:hypothetical protein
LKGLINKLLENRLTGGWTGLSLAPNEQKRSKSRKVKVTPSCCWQRDLAEFLPDSEWAILFFKTAGFNPSPTPPILLLTYSAGSGANLLHLGFRPLHFREACGSFPAG